MIEVTGQLKAGTGHIPSGQANTAEIRGFLQDLQIQLFHHGVQGDGIGIDHGRSLLILSIWIYYSRLKKEYQYLFKKTKNFEKSACIFLKSLLSYLSACEGRSMINEKNGGAKNG